ncbi:MAG: hypothetical protein K6D02_09515 [Lachnospiraceae bacterium]|nr:hypothetical protein [Lachnospiraceae bacterium]
MDFLKELEKFKPSPEIEETEEMVKTEDSVDAIDIVSEYLIRKEKSK